MKKLKSLAEKPVIGRVFKKALVGLASKHAGGVSEHFCAYLRAQIADTESLRGEVYNLRHQVYCEELNFEDTRDNAQELDEFDLRSTHCFVRHLGSGAMAGTVRLIISSDSSELLPIEKYCSGAIEDELFAPRNFPRESICEISRLAVPRQFRKRSTDNYKGAAVGGIDIHSITKNEARCFPYIAVSLYMSAAAMAFHSNRSHGYFMMEPHMARNLSYLGIDIRQLGSPIEYHGLRAPYYINAEMFRKSVSSGFAKLLKTLEKELFDQGPGGSA